MKSKIRITLFLVSIMLSLMASDGVPRAAAVTLNIKIPNPVLYLTGTEAYSTLGGLLRSKRKTALRILRSGQAGGPWQYLVCPGGRCDSAELDLYRDDGSANKYEIQIQPRGNNSLIRGRCKLFQDGMAFRFAVTPGSL